MFKPTTKFLIVDDFGTMRKIVKKALTDLGYGNSVEAVDGLNAYQLLVEHAKSGEPFDFVISDWNMPNMLGIELLKKCRSEDPFKNLPFMLVTAESEQSQILEAAKAGVTDYVIKPFSPAMLKSKLENAYKKVNTSAKAA
ncbi:response regulator [bacterium]|nr:response regulator [bacterium]